MPFFRARVASIEPHRSEMTKVVLRYALVSIDPKQNLTVTPKLFEKEEEPRPYADRIEFTVKESHWSTLAIPSKSKSRNT